MYGKGIFVIGLVLVNLHTNGARGLINSSSHAHFHRLIFSVHTFENIWWNPKIFRMLHLSRKLYRIKLQHRTQFLDRSRTKGIVWGKLKYNLYTVYHISSYITYPEISEIIPGCSKFWFSTISISMMLLDKCSSIIRKFVPPKPLQWEE